MPAKILNVKAYIFVIFILLTSNLYSQDSTSLKFTAEDIIKEAIEINVDVNKDLQSYMCSTRTSVFYKFDTKIDEYLSFRVIDDHTSGVIFWEKPDKFKYFVSNILKNQNIIDTIITPFSLIRNNLTSTVNFDSFKVISPLSDSSLKYYDYKIKSIVIVDEKLKVYDIEFEPKRNDKPALIGSFRIEDENFTLLEADFTFNDKYKYPWVIESLGFKFKYVRYAKKYTLTERIESYVKLKFPLIGEGDMFFTADFYNFVVNAEVEDIIFKGPKFDLSEAKMTVSENAADINGLKAKIMQEKRKKYEKKYEKFLVRDADISDIIAYNRIQGLYIGHRFKTGNKLSHHLGLDIKFGYGVLDKKWNYKTTLKSKGIIDDKIKLSISKYDHLYNNTIWMFPEGFNSVYAALFKIDFLNYYYKSGWDFSAKFWPVQPLGLKIKYFTENHISSVTNADFSLFRKSSKFRNNPEIEDGKYSGLRFQIHYNSRFGYIEKSKGWSIFSDFTFANDIFGKNSNNFNRFFLDVENFNYISKDFSYEINLKYGYGTGRIPLQYKFSYTLLPEFGLPKNIKYNFGNRFLLTDFSVFFGRKILKNIKIPFFRLQFMAFYTRLNLYDNKSNNNFFRFPGDNWKNFIGIGLDEINGIFQVRFTKDLIAFNIKKIIPFYKYK